MALTLNGSTGLSGIVGSAGTPALQGTDTNTGYFFGTDTLGLSTGGSQRLHIDSDGDVGIGVTSVLAPLHVFNASNNTIARLESGDATCRLQIKDNTGEVYIAANGDDLILANTSSVSESFRITSTGKISQGGHTPAYEYDLRGTGLQSVLIGSENAGGAMLILDGDSNGDGAGTDYASMSHTSDGNIEINNRKTGSIIFKNTSSELERFRIQSDGNVKINDGDLIIGTNGHGIDFSATESGNVISNGSILDDYEEGIYTPTVTGASGSWTLHSNYNKLSYTKIGRMVHFSGYISIDGESSPSGNINVSLPFTVGANTGSALNKYSAVTLSLRSHGSTNITNVIGAPQPGTTYMNILSVHPDGSHTWMTHSDVDTDWNLRIGGSFYV